MQHHMDLAVQTVQAENQVHYERRHPEETALYQLVQDNVETFFAQVEAETGAYLSLNHPYIVRQANVA